MGIPTEQSSGKEPPKQVEPYLTESAVPSSPSLFLNLPQTPPHVGHCQDNDDLVFPYISCNLMGEEDDIANDSFLYQYGPNHHPSLLTAGQPSFAQILSGATASDGLATWPCNSSPLQWPKGTPQYYSSYCDSMLASAAQGGDIIHDDPSFFWMNDGSGMLPAAESSSCCSMDEISMAFFKGMEEANKLLPSTLDCGKGKQKKRLYGKEGMAAIRSSEQQKAAPGSSEEEAAARKMLDQLMLNDYDPSHADMQELLVPVVTERTPHGGRRGAGATTRHEVVDLHAMLMRCAEAVSTNNRHAAADLLQQIRRHSSPTGDGVQRLAHCFADGLEARLAGAGNQLYQSLTEKSASAARVLKAFRLYKAVCSILPVRFLFSSKTICNAVAGSNKLHVVQYGLCYGFEWPDLLHMLAHREGGPPEVRLTSIDTPLTAIEETGHRISNCAHQLRVPFRFHNIAAAKLEHVCAEDLDINPNEVLVVVCRFQFRTLMDESVVVDSPNPRDTVLNNIRRMRPKVFIHAVINASYSGAFFMTRFRVALNNFTALFDMIDTIVPRDNQSRLVVEQELARRAMNIIACEGADRVERPQNYKQWQARSQRAGLRQLPLDPHIVQLTKHKVKKEYRKYIVIDEDHHWLLKGWKGRVLYALSTWTT